MAGALSTQHQLSAHIFYHYGCPIVCAYTQGTLPMLGLPDKTVELGTTFIPKDVFLDYLADISPQYT